MGKASTVEKFLSSPIVKDSNNREYFLVANIELFACKVDVCIPCTSPRDKYGALKLVAQIESREFGGSIFYHSVGRKASLLEAIQQLYNGIGIWQMNTAINQLAWLRANNYWIH